MNRQMCFHLGACQSKIDFCMMCVCDWTNACDAVVAVHKIIASLACSCNHTADPMQLVCRVACTNMLIRVRLQCFIPHTLLISRLFCLFIDGKRSCISQCQNVRDFDS